MFVCYAGPLLRCVPPTQRSMPSKLHTIGLAVEHSLPCRSVRRIGTPTKRCASPSGGAGGSVLAVARLEQPVRARDPSSARAL